MSHSTVVMIKVIDSDKILCVCARARRHGKFYELKKWYYKSVFVVFVQITMMKTGLLDILEKLFRIL